VTGQTDLRWEVKWWMNPRKPTEEEYQQLFSLIREQQGMPSDPEEEKDLMEFIKNSAVAMFDGYITDGPGYVGRIMVVVWTGSPTMYEAYIWNRDGQIEYCKQEF
jgi:hypothetical protein